MSLHQWYIPSVDFYFETHIVVLMTQSREESEPSVEIDS
jgi:hypothetical protein